MFKKHFLDSNILFLQFTIWLQNEQLFCQFFNYFKFSLTYTISLNSKYIPTLTVAVLDMNVNWIEYDILCL